MGKNVTCQAANGLIRLKPLLKGFKTVEPLKILRLIKQNYWQDIYPNIWTILLTVPVTIANGERSFSKTYKTYNLLCVRKDYQIMEFRP